MIHGEIVGPSPGGMRWWENRFLRDRASAADEPDDLGAHDNASDTATATSPTSASEIRYAVMPASL